MQSTAECSTVTYRAIRILARRGHDCDPHSYDGLTTSNSVVLTVERFMMRGAGAGAGGGAAAGACELRIKIGKFLETEALELAPPLI